jgi:hypothetical protein
MKFKDAAYEILKKIGKPLHYKDIASKAIEAGILDTEGRTPEASMGALLYTDTLRQDSRFRRGEKPGTFTIKAFASPSIQQHFEDINNGFAKDLRKHLLSIHPEKFEVLIRLLLDEMGFDETEKTSYSNDKGVDVRGILRSNPLSEVKIAIQAKRWSHNVGSGVVRDLRGSLKVADSEQGLIVTPGDFSPGAIDESQAPGKTPIRLINGSQLVDLLIKYHVGVKTEEYTVPIIDSDYWTEVLGVKFSEDDGLREPKKKEGSKTDIQVSFPLPIQAIHKDQSFTAHLLDLNGNVKFQGQFFKTPTAAAKTITVDWKSVNGWDFWRYVDPISGSLVKIGKLKKL